MNLAIHPGFESFRQVFRFGVKRLQLFRQGEIGVAEFVGTPVRAGTRWLLEIREGLLNIIQVPFNPDHLFEVLLMLGHELRGSRYFHGVRHFGLATQTLDFDAFGREGGPAENLSFAAVLSGNQSTFTNNRAPRQQVSRF